MIPRVHIHASAPTRIDLAGGTLDIWPLYLFHDGAQTLNAAISLRAQLRPAVAHRIGGWSSSRRTPSERVEVDHWSQLRDTHDLRLLGRLLHYFQAEGLELHDAIRLARRRGHRRDRRRSTSPSAARSTPGAAGTGRPTRSSRSR